MTRAPDPAPGKRTLPRRALLAGGLACGLGAADAFLLEPRWLQVERVPLMLPGLGAGWRGATIALLSDTHCGPNTTPAWIEHAVARTNELRPDLVLLLGDYVHRGARYIRPGIAPFAKLAAPGGVFAVLGNHDHWDGREATLAALADANARPLVNASVSLERGGDLLAIGGVGDFMEDEQLLEQTFAGVPAAVPRVLMSHNPDYAEVMAPQVRVDLMVSGHTHGGQVRIPGLGAPILPSRYGRKYAQGLAQGPLCPVFVTRGVSTISPPVRLLCRPEITLLQLA
jgi:hypothetical protein